MRYDFNYIFFNMMNLLWSGRTRCVETLYADDIEVAAVEEENSELRKQVRVAVLW